MKLLRNAIFCAVFALATGCHSYLRPFNDGWIPEPPVPTRGGEMLQAIDGELVVVPARGDIGASLGVRLAPGDRSVDVRACLRERTGLEPGDRIRIVCPSIGDTTGAKIGQPLERTFAELRAMSGAHDVTKLDDLRGYADVEGQLTLYLGLVRGGREVVVAVDAGRWKQPRQALPISHNRQQSFRQCGVEVAYLDDLGDRLPVHAKNGDLMVVRVAVDSPAAIAGLRPFDVIPNEKELATFIDQSSTVGGELVTLVARDRDGARKELTFSRVQGMPTDVWFPFLFSYQNDGRRKHVGIGPFDALFHYSSKLRVDDASDVYETAYVTESRWSFLTVFQHDATSKPSGATGKTMLQPLIDPERVIYFSEWIEARGD